MLKDTKAMSKKKRLPYSKRSDLEKIESNWTKLCGLLTREEWSGAVLRASIALEIATNLAVREELQVKRKLESEFVDSLLKWANGIQGKFDRLLLPVTRGTDAHSKFKHVKVKVTGINNERNSVAHRGQFKKRITAEKVALDAKGVIEVLVGEYQENYSLRGLEDCLNSTSSRSRKSRG